MADIADTKPALTADSTIEIGGKSYRQFHPMHRKITDGTVRCIACGQIDDEPYHEAAYCVGMGGALPFPTSTLTINLKADSGFKCTSSQRITLDQWCRISTILNEGASK